MRLMTNRLEQLARGERGQAMLAVLVCLVLGGLAIAPVMSFAATDINSVSLKQRRMMGLYGADAGIENVLWALKSGMPLPTSLPQTVNGATVTMTTINKGSYTLVAGNWVTPGGPHSSDLSIASSMVWDGGHNAYRYTVTCTWSGPGNCKLIEVGARLPVGYNYQNGSAALFGGNLSTANPTNTLDGDGAHLLDWSFSQHTINPTGTQTFYVTGSGNLNGDYAWATASRGDVGACGELTGSFYDTTATGTKSGVIVGKVEANAMVTGGSLYVTSYRILR